jgi:hypothetical protein
MALVTGVLGATALGFFAFVVFRAAMRSTNEGRA